MEAFLLALPTILRIVGWMLNKGKASEETKKKLQELIKNAQQDGLISMENSEKLMSHREKLLAQRKKNQS